MLQRQATRCGTVTCLPLIHLLDSSGLNTDKLWLLDMCAGLASTRTEDKNQRKNPKRQSKDHAREEEVSEQLSDVDTDCGVGQA